VKIWLTNTRRQSTHFVRRQDYVIAPSTWARDGCMYVSLAHKKGKSVYFNAPIPLSPHGTKGNVIIPIALIQNLNRSTKIYNYPDAQSAFFASNSHPRQMWFGSDIKSPRPSLESVDRRESQLARPESPLDLRLCRGETS